MLRDYRVIAPNHTHAGKPLTVGQVIGLRPETANRYPQVFAAVDPAPQPAKPPRRAPTHAALAAHPSIED